MAQSRAFVAVGAVLLLLLSGCGQDEDESDLADDAFDGVSITVGSKNFTEQYVLSEIFIQALEARGAEVTDATDTGDTPATRAALEAGEIDAYFEYNATGWVEHLGKSDPEPDGETLTELVREADAGNGIEWIGRSTFNDTYGFAIAPEIRQDNLASRSNNGEAFDMALMAEYMADNDDAVLCVEPEFPDRADGLILFEEATDYAVPEDRIRVFDDAAEVYGAVADGDCAFGEVFTTDGRLNALELTTVVDPGVFYVYNASLNIRSDVYNQAPEAFDELAERILKPLSQARITELNQRVSDGEPLEDVAEEYLDEFEINP